MDGKVGVLGITGSGKTFTAVGMAEQLLDVGRQVIIIDPTGAYHGMRSAFPLPIFGGKAGDVAIGEGDGEAVARAIVDMKLSAIVDVSLLLKESHAAARRFMGPFVAALKNSPAAPRYLVIDEADEFMPENASGDVTRLFGDLKWIVRRGRIEGWRVMMVTQRPQDIAKSVLTQCETMVIHKLTAPQDRRAVEEWVKGNADAGQAKEVLGTLARLETGEAWIWSPRHDLLVKARLPLNRSADTSRTPEAGDDGARVVRLEPADLDTIRAALAKPAEVVQPDPKNPDPAPMTQLLADLEEMRSLATAAYERGKVAGISIGITRAREAINALRVPEIIKEIPAQGGGGPTVDEGQTEGRQVMMSATPRATAPAPAARTATEKAGGGNASPADLPPRRVRILDAIAWGCDHFRRASIDRDIAAWLADTSPRSSSYANDLGALRSAGLVDYPGSGLLALTAAGLEIAAQPSAPTTRAALWQAIASKLPPRQVRIVDALFEEAPLDRTTLAVRTETSATSSSFANDLGRLRTLGLIDYPAPRSVGLGRVWQ